MSHVCKGWPFRINALPLLHPRTIYGLHCCSSLHEVGIRNDCASLYEEWSTFVEDCLRDFLFVARYVLKPPGSGSPSDCRSSTSISGSATVAASTRSSSTSSTSMVGTAAAVASMVCAMLAVGTSKRVSLCCAFLWYSAHEMNCDQQVAHPDVRAGTTW